jgi:hypothetical protein
MLLTIYQRVDPKWSQCIRESTNRYIKDYMRKHNVNRFNETNYNEFNYNQTNYKGLTVMKDDNNKNNDKNQLVLLTLVSLFSFLAGYHCKRIIL